MDGLGSFEWEERGLSQRSADGNGQLRLDSFEVRGGRLSAPCGGQRSVETGEEDCLRLAEGNDQLRLQFD